MTATVEVKHDVSPADVVSDLPPGDVLANLTPEVIEHRANCLCDKAERAKPAVMFNERDWVFDLLGDMILDALDRKLIEHDVEPMIRTKERRYNAQGEPIGPDLGIRSCDAYLYWRVLDRVFGVLERGAERQR